MITLAHLRSLLERALTHTENPAIVWLADRTVEGLARVYLPVCVQIAPPIHHSLPAYLVPAFQCIAGSVPLDLSDPGTAHALLVALALALGLDPGVGGLAVSLTRDDFYSRWNLRVCGGRLVAFNANKTGHHCERSRMRHVFAPIVAAEPDPIKALALAALHVLENP